MFTASNFVRVINIKEHSSSNYLVEATIYPKQMVHNAIQYGLINEKNAVNFREWLLHTSMYYKKQKKVSKQIYVNYQIVPKEDT